ncbi:MAG: TonB-dependent receptor [Acidobacteria bacterium]|nr:TonB-dependent receptor [Acidobacteriota bacterium]
MKLPIPLFLLPALLSAQDALLSGRVTDESGAAVAGALVVVRGADRSALKSAPSGPDGAFRFEMPRPGTFSLVVTRSGFSPGNHSVLVERGKPADVLVRLTIQPVGSEVTVTAETSRVAEALDVPQRTNVIAQGNIDQRLRMVNVDLFGEEAGVDVQRTAPAMGGVAVRGLLGKNVAVYRDGVRYTTSAQRGGVSTFWNLNDATSLDSVEVLRGPNSAQYGSDSLGGTVHFLSRAAGLGSPQGVHGEFSPAYFSAAHAFGGNLLFSYGAPRAGAVLNLSERRVNTLRTGGGIDSHAAVTRFLGLPSTIFGDRLPDTAFTQYGGMLHVQYAVTPSAQLVAHYDRNQQDGAQRYDQLLGGDGNLIADLRNLMLDFGYLRYSQFGATWFDRFTATLSYNAQREERVNQGGNGNPLGGISHQYERTRAWGTSIYLARRFGRNDLLIGGDGYAERERAPAFTFNPSNGSTVFSRPRVPDGARYLLYGIYLQDVWDPFRSGRLRLTGAVRFGGASYHSRASYSPIVNGLPLWPNDSLAANAVTGRLGATFRFAEPLRLYFNYSRGFRAPGITDLGTVGIQGNGLFETSYADLAGRGAFVGDRADDLAVSSGRPVAPVRPETSDNFDAGFAIRNSRVRIEAGGFRMSLNDTIVSQTLILPQGAVGQPLGDQIITRQLAGGGVFVPAATSPVLVRSNLGGAHIYGLEHQLEVKLARAISFAGNLAWIYAEDARSGLAPDIEGGIPPLTGNLRVRWAQPARRYWVEVYSTLAGRQDRLSSLALSDRRTGATRSRSNIANFFNNGARVRGLSAGGVLLPTGETLAQVQNRVLGSASSAPMFLAIPGYAIHGVRSGYQLSERSSVYADCGNIFDKSYRGVSWGVDGTGFSLAVRYRYQF